MKLTEEELRNRIQVVTGKRDHLKSLPYPYCNPVHIALYDGEIAGLLWCLNHLIGDTGSNKNLR